MTAVPKDPAISELRDLFRYLQEFRAVYETTGREEVQTPYGNRWSIWDLEYLYVISQQRLTLRQKQAISLCLVHNMREKDAAAAMGVSLTNPVMMYATLGIRRLLDMISNGELDGFRSVDASGVLREKRRRKALHALADSIKNDVSITHADCWNYRRLVPGKPPRIMIRSVFSASGFVLVHPLSVMYEAHVGPIPPRTHVVHWAPPEESPCVNPSHGLLAKIRM